MGKAFASGQNALAICDRCGFTTKLRKLQSQIVNQRASGLLVCPDCLDEDHPQLQIGKVKVSDPQGLRNPRSDLPERAASREIPE